jgi:hypothetical protein
MSDTPEATHVLVPVPVPVPVPVLVFAPSSMPRVRRKPVHPRQWRGPGVCGLRNAPAAGAFVPRTWSTPDEIRAWQCGTNVPNRVTDRTPCCVCGRGRHGGEPGKCDGVCCEEERVLALHPHSLLHAPMVAYVGASRSNASRASARIACMYCGADVGSEWVTVRAPEDETGGVFCDVRCMAVHYHTLIEGMKAYHTAASQSAGHVNTYHVTHDAAVAAASVHTPAAVAPAPAVAAPSTVTACVAPAPAAGVISIKIPLHTLAPTLFPLGRSKITQIV